MALIAQYLLAGDVTDETGSHDGTAVGSPTFGEGPVGEANTAIVLNGTTQYVNINAVNTAMGTTSMTVTMFAKTSTAAEAYMFGRTSSTGGTDKVKFGTDTGGEFDLYVATGQKGPGSTIDDGAWHYISMTYDSSANEVRAYLDDSTTPDITDDSAFQDFLGTDVFAIGAEWDAGPAAASFFTGSIADVRLYNTILSTSAMQDIRQEMLGGTSTRSLTSPFGYITKVK